MARPKLHDAQLRARLLERAAQMVADGGVGALSLRSLASAEGTSTTAVYSLFGGKPGLVMALLERGFELLHLALAGGDRHQPPLEALRALGRRYWRWALQNPHLYQVMFDPVARAYSPTAAARRGPSPLHDHVHRTVGGGEPAGHSDSIAFALWSTLHGMVLLVLAGCGPSDEVALDRVLTRTLTAWVRDEPAERPSVRA